MKTQLWDLDSSHTDLSMKWSLLLEGIQKDLSRTPDLGRINKSLFWRSHIQETSDPSMLNVWPSLPRITMVTCLPRSLALPPTEGASVTTYTAAATPSATFLSRANTKGLFKAPSAATQWRMLSGQVKYTTLKQLRIFHPESLCTDARRPLFTPLFNLKLRPQRLYFLSPPVQLCPPLSVMWCSTPSVSYTTGHKVCRRSPCCKGKHTYQR